MDLADDKQQIMDRLDPIEVIGQYVRLQRAGQRFKALCPFHEEKTPSFTVDPQSGLWYCFGCSQGGDLFSFVMSREGLSFPETLRMLARRAGVTLQDDPLSGPRRERRELLERANEIACKRFIAHLFEAPGAEHARQYLRQRKFTRQSIERFGIGFALDSWDDLLKALAAEGINAEMAEEAGLAKRSDRGGHYDTFRNRIIFPISDISGRTIGFGGRSMDPENPAKYLNSPETPLFHKRETIYALDLARQSITSEGQVLICEGYTDVVSLHQAGVGNAVAALGTALTSQQLQLLARYADEVVLVYDSDTAGARAALNNLEVVAGAQIGASLIVLPEGTDPDEFVMKHGADAFRTLLEGRVSPVEYQFRSIFNQQRGRGADGAAAAARAVVEILLKIDDWPLRDEFVARAADLWGQGDPARTDSMARVLKMELQRQIRGHGRQRRDTASPRDSGFITDALTRPSTGLLRAQTELLIEALHDDEMAALVVDALTPEEMLTEEDGKILEALAAQFAQEGSVDAGALVEGLPEEGGVRRRGVELTVADVGRLEVEGDDARRAQIECTIRRLRTQRRSGGALAQAQSESALVEDEGLVVENFEELQRQVIEGINSGELSLDDPIVQCYYSICRGLRGSEGRGYFGEAQSARAASVPQQGSSGGIAEFPMEDRDVNEVSLPPQDTQEEPSGPPTNDPWEVEDGDPFLDEQ